MIFFTCKFFGLCFTMELCLFKNKNSRIFIVTNLLRQLLLSDTFITRRLRCSERHFSIIVGVVKGLRDDNGNYRSAHLYLTCRIQIKSNGTPEKCRKDNDRRAENALKT